MNAETVGGRPRGKLAERRHDEIVKALKSELAKYMSSKRRHDGFEFVEGYGQKSIDSFPSLPM